MKYSISNWIYGDEPLRTTFERLKRYGYDGIELKGEPQEYQPHEVNPLCRKFDLEVLSIAGIYPWPTKERDLANAHSQVRERAVKYLRECVDFALDVGAPLIIVIPSAVAKTSPVGHFESEKVWVVAAEREWNYALESVRTAAAYAEQEGIFLAVEPINRYETFLVNNVDQGLRHQESGDDHSCGGPDETSLHEVARHKGRKDGSQDLYYLFDAGSLPPLVLRDQVRNDALVRALSGVGGDLEQHIPGAEEREVASC